jgi:phospholipid/cholesterol/gamma-HCH transport system substrate-binding protein
MRIIRPLNQYNPLWLGITAAIIGVLLLAGTFAVGTLGFGDDHYEAEFAHTAGIRPNDEVRIAGIGVGQVTGTRLDGDHVVVSFRTNQDVHLGRDTKAVVKLATLLGGRYLELQPAGPGALPDNRIKLVNTSVPFDLQQAIETSTPAIEGLDAAKLRTALEAVTKNLYGDGATVSKALDGVTQLSNMISKRDQQLGQLISSADALTTIVNKDKAALFTMMGQADGLFKILLDRRDLIRGILTDFKTLIAQVRDLLNDNRPQLQPLFNNLTGITDILARTNDALDRALQVIAPTARYVNNAFGNGPYADIYLPYAIFPDNLLCTARVVTGCQ